MKVRDLIIGLIYAVLGWALLLGMDPLNSHDWQILVFFGLSALLLKTP